MSEKRYDIERLLIEKINRDINGQKWKQNASCNSFHLGKRMPNIKNDSECSWAETPGCKLIITHLII